MSIICWNCRGLGDPRTVQEIMALEANKKPNFIFLMETKVRRIHAERLKCKMDFAGVFYVDSGGVGGGLALFWKTKNSAKLLSYSKNHVDIEVNISGTSPWRFTGFYGFPERNRRHLSWDLLRSLRPKSSLPWLVAGDFNEIASPHEKRGLHSHPNSLMDNFNKALEDCFLFDLGAQGRFFTWEKGRGTENWVEERLDRAVAEADWCLLYPYAVVRNMEVLTSDHSAIFIDTEKPQVRRRRRSFMFENAWLKDSGCRGVVKQCWSFTQGEEVPNRLKFCAGELKAWGGVFGKRIAKDIDRLKIHLGNLRGKYDAVSLKEFKITDSKLHALLHQQHTYWKQRAKQHWLNEGDHNTRFFHHQASRRKRKNYISKLRDLTGKWHEGEAMNRLISTYFVDIFTSRGAHDFAELDGFTPKISVTDNANLTRPFTAEEVKDAIFSMAPDKAPGPDGFNPAFFQHFWADVGADVSDFVLHTIQSRAFTPGLNDTNISLIPKKDTPELVSDMRPISLCNVIYKIMAKMIANRLKTLLEKTIEETQSAFIPNRLITDNVLIASEVIHYLNRKREGYTGWCALKLDMAKAYDKMEWAFLRKMLEVMGFEHNFIDLIMLCVSTVRYRVLVNGDLTETIVPTRGLRQGDPLSPYLFILCAEGLAHIINRAIVKGYWSYCKISRNAPGMATAY
ncbi:unnamed protein product [Cuscuta epithymum]|uniref:Reverse transcriptase domain-containing protein n=1 Tax=Cuscuta epithymum TaxID=186058 RepID=A0AAV0DZI7_9ASTE|nr:unnamed protein product [Cuscuta epithymum]